MKFRINGVYQNEFLYEYIPKRIMQEFKRYNNLGTFKHMDLFLDKIKLGYTTIDVLEYATKHMTCDLEGKYNLYIFDTNKQFYNTPYTIRQLVGLIESGNLEVRGTRVIQKTLNLVSLCEKRLYYDWLYRG